ncbi:hypothetical protein PSPO01_05950 [Paraphaeosphaeria sporulosa]
MESTHTQPYGRATWRGQKRSDAAGESPVLFIVICAAHRQSRLAAASYIDATDVARLWSESGTDGPGGASCDGTHRAIVHLAAAREARFTSQRSVSEREQTL